MSRIDPLLRLMVGVNGAKSFRVLAIVALPSLAALLMLGGCGREPEPQAEPGAEGGSDSTLVAPDADDEALQPAAGPAGTPGPAGNRPTPTLAGPPATPSPAATSMLPALAIEQPPTPPVTPTALPATGAPLTDMPLPTPYGVYSWTLKVPILMYHYVSEPPADADVYRQDLSVTPQQFREQMSFLRDNGYTPVDLYDLSLAITSMKELPEKPIVLTFDDGYLDNYENAFPILREFGFKGVFFVITEFIDNGREGYMTWPQIEEMAAAGMRVESHSRTHPDLTTLDRDGLIYEILGSQQTLAAHIGYTPRYFCYPGGDYDQEVLDIVRELDLWGATTTENGSWHGFNDRFEWTRVRVRNATTLDEFALITHLEGTARGKSPENQ